MNDHVEKTQKKQKAQAEAPLKAVNWTALKRAAEDNGFEPEDGGGIQLETITVELPDTALHTDELAPAPHDAQTDHETPDEPQIDEEPEPDEASSPLKSLNWSALKSAAEPFVTEEADATVVATEETGVDSPPEEEVDDSAPEEATPAPQIEFGALQRAAAILRIASESAKETEAEEPQPQTPEEEPNAVAEPDAYDMRAAMQQMTAELGELRGEVKDLSLIQSRLAEHGMAQDKVFDVLHAELQDYKVDFVYERFKPTIRSLLYLCDAFEQFDREIQLKELPDEEERRGTVSPRLVRENISFFHGQLVEALATCAVTPMETPQGPFDPHLHKVVKVVPVAADADNTIQEVCRSGWYLNEKLLRPADVIVGKAGRTETREASSSEASKAEN